MIAKKAVLISAFVLIFLGFCGCSSENTAKKVEETFGYGEFSSEEIYILPEGGFTAPEEPESETMAETVAETVPYEEKEQEVTKIVLENPPYEGGGIVLPDDEL